MSFGLVGVVVGGDGLVFAAADRLLWLGLVVGLGVLVVASAARSRSLVRRFVTGRMLSLLGVGVGGWRGLWGGLVVVLALGLVVVGLARPQWGVEEREVTRVGRDVVFVIDVSRSMLAEDLVPNRLERAKLWVRDALAARRGDRVAIVGFAGGVNVASPLTLDYGFAELALDGLSRESVSVGGTNIGDALRRVMGDVFDLDGELVEARERDVVLITDGEDHGSLPVDAAAVLGDRGVRLIAIGIGNRDGATIPVVDGGGRVDVLRYEGEVVRTRLDMETLRAMASATPGGRAIEVETGDLDLAGVYEGLVRAGARSALTEGVSEVGVDRYGWVVWPALVLVVLERLMSGRVGRGGRLRAGGGDGALAYRGGR